MSSQFFESQVALPMNASGGEPTLRQERGQEVSIPLLLHKHQRLVLTWRAVHANNYLCIGKLHELVKFCYLQFQCIFLVFNLKYFILESFM